MSEDVKGRFDQAISLCRSGQNAEAVLVLTELVETSLFANEPPRARAAVHWYLGGVYLHFLDDCVSAEANYRVSLALSPRSERASLGLFHSLIGQRRVEEALDECKRFLDGGESDEYRRLLNEIAEG